jgi:steroid delta-isomerase-like uncharacterized protein
MRRLLNLLLAVVVVVGIAAGIHPSVSAQGATPVVSQEELDQNKAVARRVLAEILSAGQVEVADEVFADPFITHLGNAAFSGGTDPFKAFVLGLRTSFPDLHYTPNDVLADDHLVVIRMTATGTQDGEFNGIPPTHNKAWGVTDLIQFRIEDGKIQEIWFLVDTLTLVRQIGAVPPAPGSPTGPEGTPEAEAQLTQTSDADRAANKELALRWFDFANGNDAVADEIFASDHVHHQMINPGEGSGADGQRQLLEEIRAGFPDIAFAPQEAVADGDRVSVRWVMSGTNSGTFEGIPPFQIPATGKEVQVNGLTIFRIEDGKIVETWSNYDAFGLLGQLGALGSAGATAPPAASPAATPGY